MHLRHGFSSLLPLLLATLSLSATMPVERREVGALILENIPPTAPEVASRLEQYNQTRGASLVGWNHAGEGLFIATRFSETANLHHVAFPGGARTQLTFFTEPLEGASVRPNADRREILIVTNEGGAENYQILLLGPDGNPRRITDGTSRHGSPVWSHDGSCFAYTSNARNGRDADLYLASADAPTEARLVLEGSPGLFPATFTPDGSAIALILRVSVSESRILLLDLASGTTCVLLGDGDSPASYGSPQFSADGKLLYYRSDESGDFSHLHVLDLASGARTDLTPDLHWGVEGLSLSPDGRWLAYSVNADGLSELYLRDLTNGTTRKVDGMPIGVLTSVEFSPDSTRFAFSLNTPTSPSDVHVLDLASGNIKRWTQSEIGGLDPANFVTPRIVRFPTFDEVNGQRRTISSILYEPAGPGPHPVVVVIHGGPEGQSRPYFTSLYQYWATELGLAVALPNVRGSTGYGKEFVNLDNGFKREDSVRDIGALLDWIATQPNLDANRVAVYGGSYGGYMVYASLQHFGDRLAGGVAVVGISHFVTFLESTAEYRRDLRRVEYGDERDPAMRAHLQAISPLTNVHRLTRPMLIGQGANDPRVPRSESEQIVAALRERGIPASYFLALNEGHGFAKKTNSDAWRLASTDFLYRLLRQ